MNFSLDPDQELFRSLLVNDLNDISSILPNVKTKAALKCDHCDELFSDISDKKQHERSHYSYKCNKCFVAFTSKVSLGAHVLSCQNDRIQKIKKEKSLSGGGIKQEPTDKGDITEEMTRRPAKRIRNSPSWDLGPVDGELSVKTEIMTEITRRDPSIRSRLATMLEMRSGLWVCVQDNCDKKFRDKGHAFDHVENHVNYLVYPCKTPGCGKTYRTWTSLRSHNKINGGCRAK